MGEEPLLNMERAEKLSVLQPADRPQTQLERCFELAEAQNKMLYSLAHKLEPVSNLTGTDPAKDMPTDFHISSLAQQLQTNLSLIIKITEELVV